MTEKKVPKHIQKAKETIDRHEKLFGDFKEIKDKRVGNKFGAKLKTDELKKLAYESYCNHIAQGKTHKSWYFEHEDLTLSWQSMESYLKNEPEAFNPKHKQVAEAKGLESWVQQGREMMVSEKRCQPAIYQMMMRNIHGWDKETQEESQSRLVREARHLDAVFKGLELKDKESETE